jgi:DNA-binding CsgD family transcriptional regulator
MTVVEIAEPDISGFKDEYWAARAWEGYLKNGLGALLIEIARIEKIKNSPDCILIPSTYVNERDERIDSDLRPIIQRYNPEKEVIFIFLYPSGKLVYYVWPTPENLNPPIACKQYRRKHPIGIRPNPNRSIEENLRVFSDDLLYEKGDLEHERKQILSDPARQVMFLKGIMECRERLQTELEAGGIGQDPDGHAYIIDEPSSSPLSSFERLRFIAKLVNYLAVSLASHQARQVYEAAKAPSEQCLKEMTEAALITLDKTSIFIGMKLFSNMTEDGNLGMDEEEIRNIFLLITAGKIREGIKKYPRILSVLQTEAKAEGKTVEDILLSNLLNSTFLVLAENKIEPHLLSTSDSKRLHKKIIKSAISESSPQKEIAISDELLKYLEQPDPYSTDFARQLESDDEHAAWLDRAGLSTAEHEVFELKSQGFTEEKIAKNTGRSVGTVKSLLFRARQKFKRTHKT